MPRLHASLVVGSLSLLIVACAALTVAAEPAWRYALATAEALHRPSAYIEAVMAARPVPPPAAPRHVVRAEEGR